MANETLLPERDATPLDEVLSAAEELLVDTAGDHDLDCPGDCFTEDGDEPCRTMALYVRLDRALRPGKDELDRVRADTEALRCERDEAWGRGVLARATAAVDGRETVASLQRAERERDEARAERDALAAALRSLLAGVDAALPGRFTVAGVDEARAVLTGTPTTDLPDEFHCHGCDAWRPAAELVRCPRCERECCAACVRDHRGNVMTADGMRRCVEVSDAR